MNLDERRAALLRTMDLAGLDAAAIDALALVAAPREVPASATINEDDRRSSALYVVVDGMIAVTSRSEHRRAPVESMLGPGGLFGEDALAGVGMMGATAYRASRLLVLPRAAVQEVAAAHPSVAALVRRMTQIQRHAPWIVDHLRRSPLFLHVPPGEIYPLLEGAGLVDAGPDAIVWGPDERDQGLVLVLDGEVRLHTPADVVAEGRPWRARPVMLGPGAVFGEHALFRPGPLLQEVQAGGDGCRLLRLREDVFRQQLSASPSFRRGILASGILAEDDRVALVTAQSGARGGSPPRRSQSSADIDLLRSNWIALVGDRPGLPLTVMTEWLAHAAAEEWGDRVLVAYLDATAPERPDLSGLNHPSGVSHIRLRPDRPPLHPEFVDAALHAQLVLLVFGDIDPLANDVWLRRVRRTVYVATRPYEPVHPRLLDNVTRPLVYTALVPSGSPRPGEPRDVPRGTVRLHRDLVALAGQGRPLRELGPRDRAQVGRWMRAVTERRVGLALGGGGALAYAHLAVIQEVARQGLPIDLVAGASGGSLVGGFYAVGEQLPLDPLGAVPEGLEAWPALARFVNVGPDFEKVCRGGPFTSWVVADWLDRQLGAVRLEDLLVPFFPVATDIDSAVQVSVRAGPIGYGIRASGSLPGPFTPTTLDRRELPLRVGARRPLPTPEPSTRSRVRYVDGGVLNNIPDDTLYLEGAQLVLASNVVPGPQPRDPDTSRLGAIGERTHGRIPRFLREFDPFLRIDDAMRAGYMMMHSPADWQARSADAKYQARTTGHTFMSWNAGDAIRRQALDDERRGVLEDAVSQLRRRYDAMRVSPTEQNRRMRGIEHQVPALLRALEREG